MMSLGFTVIEPVHVRMEGPVMLSMGACVFLVGLGMTALKVIHVIIILTATFMNTYTQDEKSHVAMVSTT